MSKEQIKQVFEKVLESKGEKAVSVAMREAGYPETTAKNPQQVTRSKTWEKLMEKYLPDTLLIKTHKEGLKATTKKPHLIDRDDKGRPVYEYVPEDDYSVRHKYLETAYKIKNKIPQATPITAVQINFGEDKERYA